MAPLLLGQSFAQEGLRFWARRMHAYAELAEAAARCQSPADYLDVQKAFFTQAQKDYTDEGAAVAELMSHPLQSNGKGH